MNKKNLLLGSFACLVLFASIFIPISNKTIINNETNLTYNESNPYNYSIEDLFKIKAYKRVDDEVDKYSMEILFKENIENFYRIKNVDFPYYDSNNYSIEIISSNSDKIANFIYYINIDYYLIDDSKMHSKLIVAKGEVLFIFSEMDNLEIFINFEI